MGRFQFLYDRNKSFYIECWNRFPYPADETDKSIIDNNKNDGVSCYHKNWI